MSIKKKSQSMIKAAKAERFQEVIRLAEQGADLTEQDEAGLTVLDHMLSRVLFKEIYCLLDLDLGADTGDVKAKLGPFNFTPLHWAAWFGRPDWVQRLLDRGADTEEQAAGGMTPLMCAVRRQRVDCASILKAGGADASARADEGVNSEESSQNRQESMLAFCARTGLWESLAWCLENRADGGEPEKEARLAIAYLKKSKKGDNSEQRSRALAATRAYLEAVLISDATIKVQPESRRARRGI